MEGTDELVALLQCATIRTNPGTNNGYILVPLPGKTQFIMLVFNKIPIPQEWLGPTPQGQGQGQAAPGASQAMLVAQAQAQAQQAHAQQQQQQQQTSMFANQVK